MIIKATKPFCYRDPTDGTLTSYAMNEVADVENDLASAFIEEGLAEEYKVLEPKGTINITENSTGINVAQYANADVDVVAIVGNAKVG